MVQVGRALKPIHSQHGLWAAGHPVQPAGHIQPGLEHLQGRAPTVVGRQPVPRLPQEWVDNWLEWKHAELQSSSRKNFSSDLKLFYGLLAQDKNQESGERTCMQRIITLSVAGECAGELASHHGKDSAL